MKSHGIVNFTLHQTLYKVLNATVACTLWSHNHEELGKNHNNLFEKHFNPCERWGMTKTCSTNKCPYMTTMRHGYFSL